MSDKEYFRLYKNITENQARQPSPEALRNFSAALAAQSQGKRKEAEA